MREVPPAALRLRTDNPSPMPLPSPTTSFKMPGMLLGEEKVHPLVSVKLMKICGRPARDHKGHSG